VQVTVWPQLSVAVPVHLVPHAAATLSGGQHAPASVQMSVAVAQLPLLPQ
jgi:hypothetical protein